jgi:DinB superfamily
MRLIARLSMLVTLLFALILPLGAQEREGVMGDLIRDVARVEAKIVGLARAMPASAYEWKPGNGARSTGEVFIHVAADNYFMPVLMGAAAPAGTGIDAKGKHKTVEAFEKRTITRDQIIAELEKSFEFLKRTMSDTPDAKLEEQPKFESRKMTTREFWIVTDSHLHEHLGQLIAYARSNNITPPWSK